MKGKSQERARAVNSRIEDLVQRAGRAIAASDRLINQSRQLLEQSQAIRDSSARRRKPERTSN